MNQIVTTNADHHIPWNKGKLIGQKSPLKLKEIWAIRMRIPVQSCHPFQTNAATHSILKLPLIPVNVATPGW